MGQGGGGYYPPIDPGGAQKASTAASALGFVALVGSGAGSDQVANALGLGAHGPQIATAGLSLASLGHVSLFCAGLVLVAAGIVLNFVSLELHRRARKEFQERTAGGYKSPTSSTGG